MNDRQSLDRLRRSIGIDDRRPVIVGALPRATPAERIRLIEEEEERLRKAGCDPFGLEQLRPLRRRLLR